MPLLEELGVIPTEKYAHQPELFAHARHIATTYGLYENAVFNTQVPADAETARRWKRPAANTRLSCVEAQLRMCYEA